MRIVIMSNIQFYKGSYRFRRKVPVRFRQQVGKSEWLQSFATADRSEANRLALPLIQDTNAILRALEAGTFRAWSDADIRRLAQDFIECEWPRAKRDYTRHIEATFLNMDDYDPRAADKVDESQLVVPLASIADLNKRLREFLDDRRIAIDPDSKDVERLRDEATEAYMTLGLAGAAFEAPPPEPKSLTILSPAPSNGVGHDPFAGLMPDARKPFGDFLDQFLAKNGYRKDEQDDKTGASYRKAFARLEALIGRKPIALVTSLDIEAFYQSLVGTATAKGDGFLKHDTIARSISPFKRSIGLV